MGILDTNKHNNVPVLMKPFTGKNIYQIAWALVANTDKSVSATTRYVLFACSDGKLVYFPDSGEGKHSNLKKRFNDFLSLINVCTIFVFADPKPFQEKASITAMSAGPEFLALGSTDGQIILYNLDLTVDPIKFRKISSSFFILF